ncbi:MAG: tRNA pseudouridine(55) synthase TruB [Lachnospiraceae bacterium]|jgi:tRNA pseudouridine55 synthase
MINGLIVINKEKKYTSFDVVAVLRGILGTRKIGHTGTLDPDAEGVLVACVGNATKIAGFLLDESKTYEAVMLLGKTTDTQDMTGNVLEERPVSCTFEEISNCMESFVGEYDQIPPMYSAVKINGKRLYELARKGKTVDRDPRRVSISEINIKSADIPEVSFEVKCSKGTYIRTLCNDIGRKLGCGGAMKSLRRTAAGRFTIKDAVTLDELRDIVNGRSSRTIDDVIIKTDEYYGEFPKVVCAKKDDRLLENGNKIANDYGIDKSVKYVRMYLSDGMFKGIYVFHAKENVLKPFRMFV